MIGKKGKKSKLKIFPKNFKGQVTIFIIIGVLVVAAVVLLFIFLNKSDKPVVPINFDKTSPENYLSSCVEERLYEDVETLSLQGGYFNNSMSINFQFEGESFYDISYLCYTEEEGIPCSIQQPSILNHIEKELENSLSEVTEICFNEFLQSLEEEGYNVNGEYKGMNVDIKDKRIVFEVDSELTYSKEEQSKSADEIFFEYHSEIYGIGKTVQRIVSDEMRINSFDRFGYMERHPQYNIDYVVPDSKTKIYTVINENSNEKFRFAVKGGI